MRITNFGNHSIYITKEDVVKFAECNIEYIPLQCATSYCLNNKALDDFIKIEELDNLTYNGNIYTAEIKIKNYELSKMVHNKRKSNKKDPNKISVKLNCCIGCISTITWNKIEDIEYEIANIKSDIAEIKDKLLL